MSRFEIILSVDADHQADARDLGDDILKATRVSLLKGQHPGVHLDVGVAVSQPCGPSAVAAPMRTYLPGGAA